MLKLKKCRFCGRIWKHGEWIYFSDIQIPERQQLSWLIVTEAVEWEFCTCEFCKVEYPCPT